MATITQLYIEKCRSKLSARIGKEITDYHISKVLEIGTSTMTNYMKHDREADDEVAYRIAQFIEVPPMEIIGAIHAKKAKSEEVKDFWEKVKKGSVAGFSGVALASSLLSVPAPVEANQFNILNNQSIYYTNNDKNFKPPQSL